MRKFLSVRRCTRQNESCMNPTTFFIFTTLLKIVGIVFVVILPMVSYAVYAERKLSALIQDRLGPNRVGPAGLFQPIADAMKFLLKEDFTPAHVNKLYYWLAPPRPPAPAPTYHRGGGVCQPSLRRTNGDRGHQRWRSVCFCDRLARCLRNRHRWLGLELE